MTEAAKNKPYESMPQPNEDKPITIDTFSYWSIPVARIKCFNGVKNDPLIMAVYSHLLGWKKTTGQIRPSQQYIADCCCMGLSTVQKKVRLLEKMGWVKAKPAYKSGSKEILFTDYTVKDPEAILTELNASLIQQGDAAVTIKKSEAKPGGQTQRQTAIAATPSTEQPTNQPTGQNADLASKPAPVSVGQPSRMASNDDNGGGDDRTDGNSTVKQEYQKYDNGVPFLPKEPSAEETAGQVMAPLDDLRYWSCVGDEGMDDYGVMWGVEGIALDNLIGEHLKTREAEAEKNFKLQRTH